MKTACTLRAQVFLSTLGALGSLETIGILGALGTIGSLGRPETWLNAQRGGGKLTNPPQMTGEATLRTIRTLRTLGSQTTLQTQRALGAT